ncbi:MAG: hypothetical protein Q8Q07_09675, partial [Dehalococcoidales bacterium]|nr:hypothetical protein [Dehalococcoidales bacterium]
METRICAIKNPVACAINERINRFVVGVRLRGKNYRACINNTGRLEQFLVPGREGFCTVNGNPGKTDYRLFAIASGGLAAIIDTQLQMMVFEK